MLDRQYFSQLDNQELQRRLVQLLDTDAGKLVPLAGAKRAMEAVAIADELGRRGVVITGPKGGCVEG